MGVPPSTSLFFWRIIDRAGEFPAGRDYCKRKVQTCTGKLLYRDAVAPSKRIRSFEWSKTVRTTARSVWSCLACYFVFCQECFDAVGDLFAVRFECEVPCVEQMRLDILKIAAVWRCTGGRKDEIVFSPHN